MSFARSYTGIEYEAGKPGWNEANNGLAGMLGSGLPETIELAVLLRYIRSAVAKHNRALFLPTELVTLLNAIMEALSDLQIEAEGGQEENDTSTQSTKVPDALFRYWDTVATAREAYREATRVLHSSTLC